MLDHTLVNQLAELCGLTGSYQDWDGIVTIAVENKILLLKDMGFDLSSNATLNDAIANMQASIWTRSIPVVSVVHQGRPFEFTLRTAATKLNQSVDIVVLLEEGGERILTLAANTLNVIERTHIGGTEYVAMTIELPADLPLGYHQMTMNGVDESGSLIVVPETCYEPDVMRGDANNPGKKIWGSGIQLYSVRSENNWGMGDYADLDALIKGLAHNGADFIGLNPLHALYQANPEHASPYSPSSRTFANVIYINPEAVPEFSACDSARALVAEEDFQRRLADARAQDYIDYSGVAALKYAVLEALYTHFCSEHLSKNTERAQSFNAFRDEMGESLRRFATFDTLYEHFRKDDLNSWGWPCWPEAFQKPDTAQVKAFVKDNEARIVFFEYLQWLAREQSQTAQDTARQHGMMLGVYRDLAVGVDRGGADVWSDPELYCLDASVGAPPDGLGPQGQNWGLPPFKPTELYKRGYAPFIRMLRANMNSCGALRIDHAMGLFRLWWCPAGKGAKDGAYVHYSLQDQLGIIKLESHRNQCLVFGEDLGMVPDEIKEALPPAKMYSCLNGIHLQEGDQYPTLDGYKAKAMCNWTCHDTPTLKGWWEGKDVELFGELNIFDEQRMADEMNARLQTRKAVINTLTQVNELPEGVSHDHVPQIFNRELMEHMSYYLARSQVQVANIQLEDCMLVDTPVNVPGTSDEYPNWRRRLTVSLENFFRDDTNVRFFANLVGCRNA